MVGHVKRASGGQSHVGTISNCRTHALRTNARQGETVYEVGPSFSKDPPVIVFSSDEKDD